MLKKKKKFSWDKKDHCVTVLLEVRPVPDKDIFHASCCFVRGIFGYLLLL